VTVKSWACDLEEQQTRSTLIQASWMERRTAAEMEKPRLRTKSP
jgi:hypothetical protein